MPKEFLWSALYWASAVNSQGMLFLQTTQPESQSWEEEGCRKEDEFGVALGFFNARWQSAAEAERGKIWEFQRQEEENYTEALLWPTGAWFFT